jgi:hypothetical protein
LVLPYVAVELIFGVAGLVTALLSFTGAGRVIFLAAGAIGCVISLVSAPFILVTVIYLAILAGASHLPAAIATAAAPLLCIATLIDGIAPPIARTRSLRDVGIAIAAPLLLIALDKIQLFHDDGLSPEQQAQLRPKFIKAIDEEDLPALADPKIRKVIFDAPEEDGSQTGGDAILYAIARGKAKSAAVLLKKADSRFSDMYWREALTHANREVVDAVAQRFPHPEKEVWAEALRSRHPEALDLSIAHGEDATSLLCLLAGSYGVDDDQSKAKLLLQKGARKDAKCESGKNALETARDNSIPGVVSALSE